MTTETIDTVLSKAGIEPDHIYETEDGYQIECYGRRANKLIRQLEQFGFSNVEGYDSRVFRPIAEVWTWYAVATFDNRPTD